MPQIAAANVTYSMVEGSQLSSPSDPRFSAVFNVSFGNATLTYTNGGIPLTKAKLGCPATLRELYILDASNTDGLVYKYNRTSETIQIFQTANKDHVHTFIMAGGVTTTADFLYNSSGTLGKAAATNVTIAGTAPTTQGGVVTAAIAAAGLAEIITSAAVAATTIQLRAVGW